MSSVHAAGKRGPGVVRAAVKISLGCVLLGGCSAGTERFTSLEFGSGYEAAPPRSSTSASTAAINAPQYRPVRETASLSTEAAKRLSAGERYPRPVGRISASVPGRPSPCSAAVFRVIRSEDGRWLRPLRPCPSFGWDLCGAARLLALRRAKWLCTASAATGRKLRSAPQWL